MRGHIQKRKQSDRALALVMRQGSSQARTVNKIKGDDIMRKVSYYEDEGWTLKKVKAESTWACKIVKVCGGWMAFESSTDYNTWRNQK